RRSRPDAADEGGGSGAAPADRRQPPALDRNRARAAGAAPRRARPHERRRRRPVRARALSDDRPGAAGERVRPGAQHGHDRRQPAAAHPLHLLPRPGDAVQQAGAGHRLQRHRGGQSPARDLRRQRALRRDPSLGSGGRARGARGRGGRPGTGRRAADRALRVLSPARRHARARDRARAGRADRRGRGAGVRPGTPLALPEDPGPGVVRVRPGLGGGRPRHRRRGDSRRAPRRRRRRHQALAPAHRGRSPERWSGDPRNLSGGGGARDRGRQPARHERLQGRVAAARGVPRARDSRGPDVNAVTGQPRSRIDGVAKVTGAAKYAAEFARPDLAYGAIVQSTIAKGRIVAIDTAAAERAPGVLAVITHENAPKLPYQRQHPTPPVDPEIGAQLPMLQDDLVRHNGQYVALVVANTLEQATHAADLVRIAYDEEPAATSVEAALAHAFPVTEANAGSGTTASYHRGDPGRALADAPLPVGRPRVSARGHHTPNEAPATIAGRHCQRLVLHDKTQWPGNVRSYVALTFGLPEEDVRVISPFVGGAFGSALRTWPHVILAAMAAREVGRPVKIVLTRRQMY